MTATEPQLTDAERRELSEEIMRTLEAHHKLKKQNAALLAACEEAIECLERGCPPEGGYTSQVIDRIRAAIAAAS